MSVSIKSGASTTEANVDINNNLQVNLPTTKNQSGYVVAMGESHDGINGEARLVRSMKVSTDGRLRVGTDSLYWQDTFNHSQASLGAYQQIVSGSSIALSGGYLVLNFGNALNASVARFQTYKTFQLNAFGSLEVSFRLRFSAAAQTNNVCEWGLGLASGTTTPNDGVYFKLNASGALVGVININGSETTTDAMPTFSINNVDYYRIVIDQDRAEFYINNVLMGAINVVSASPTVSLARSLPLLLRNYNAATTTTAQRMEVSDFSVLSRDLVQNRLLSTQQSAMCMNSIEAPRGIAAGQTANMVNSTIPVSATLSNTAAGYTTLGGQFQFASVVGAETDYALFAYLVPTPGSTGSNKNLIICGARIETYNMGAVSATSATLLQWSLGVGSTAANLTTPDSPTVGTRAPRRIPLGVQSIPIGTVVGASVSPIDIKFDAPFLVEAGTYAHVILKMPAGSATVSQIIRGVVTINGYWE